MTLTEFKEEFKFKYDGASQGAPDLDDYEVSLLLTQAVKDLTELVFDKFETDEDSKRIASFLMKYHEGTITVDQTFGKFKKYDVTLPEKLMRILREEPSLEGCVTFPEVVSVRIDEANNLLNNSFKRPNKRRVLKIEKNKNTISVFSEAILTKYKITYIEQIVPIIVDDLDDGLSIEGLDVATETILPAYIHDKIIDIAVAKAIRTVRSSSIQSQVEQ